MLDYSQSVAAIEEIHSVARIYGGLAVAIQAVTPNDEAPAILPFEDLVTELRDERRRS